MELSQLWSEVTAFMAPRWLPSLIVVAISGVVYLLALAVLGRAQRQWVTRTATEFDD